MAGALLLAASFSNFAHANVYCSGTLTDFYIDHDGLLVVRSSWRNDWTALCSVQNVWNGVATETCYTWVGMTTTARTNNKTVGVYYVGVSDCTTLPTYGSAPAPYYYRMQ